MIQDETVTLSGFFIHPEFLYYELRSLEEISTHYAAE